MQAEYTTCREFVNELCSSAPTPGGGGASALCGAIAAALGGMVASLTIGKKKYAEVEPMMIELQSRLNKIQDEMLGLIDEDAEAFKPLSQAYKLPKETAEDIAYREDVLEKCLADACQVPIKIMEKCCEAMDAVAVLAEHGSQMAVSDAAAGMILCKAALKAASLNVFINTKSMKNRLEADSFNAKAREMLYIYESKADGTYEKVLKELTTTKKKAADGQFDYDKYFSQGGFAQDLASQFDI